MFLLMMETHRPLPRRQIKQKRINEKSGRTAKPITPAHRDIPADYRTMNGPTKTTPFRHSHLLWPVSGLTSDPLNLPMPVLRTVV